LKVLIAQQKDFTSKLTQTKLIQKNIIVNYSKCNLKLYF